jgi:hypothetical protein
MNIQHVKVTITLAVDINGLPEGVHLDQVETKMADSHWNEGRYPFYTEMLQEGLSRQVKEAIWDATVKHMLDKYGSERILIENATMSKAYHEAGKAMKSVAVYCMDSIKDARIR